MHVQFLLVVLCYLSIALTIYKRKRGKNSYPQRRETFRKDCHSQGTRLQLSFHFPDFSYGIGNHAKRAKKAFDQLGCDSRVGR